MKAEIPKNEEIMKLKKALEKISKPECPTGIHGTGTRLTKDGRAIENPCCCVYKIAREALGVK